MDGISFQKPMCNTIIIDYLHGPVTLLSTLEVLLHLIWKETPKIGTLMSYIVHVRKRG